MTALHEVTILAGLDSNQRPRVMTKAAVLT